MPPADDSPTPENVRPLGLFGRPLRYSTEVASTQDEVRAWREAGRGAVVVAERQTSGRGRRGRPWSNPGGALMFSVQLGTFEDVSSLALAPLAVAVALRSACGVGGLKWPNDLLAPDGRKLAGILLEADVRAGHVRSAVLGVGVNVHGAPIGAAGLAEFREVHRPTLLRELLWQIEVWLSASPPRVLEAWRAFNVTLERDVRVRTVRGDVIGVARDVTEDGALLVETGAGAVRIEAGDVDLIGGVSRDVTEPSSRTSGGAV